MGEAAFWGFVGASALIVAAEVAFAFRLSRMVIVLGTVLDGTAESALLSRLG